MNDEESIGKEIIKTSLFLLLVLVVTLLIVKFVAQRTVVVGYSMETTLTDGDNLVIDKLSYRFGKPKRYDVIVFPYKYEKNTYYIKRIIGLPGDTVRMDYEGKIYVNDKLIDEKYGIYKDDALIDPGLALDGVTVGEDEYFVLGDNRNHSSDSRNPAVGNIKKKDIIGKALFRIYPFNKMKKVR